MAETISLDQEQQVKKLKRLLEGWRMALLPLKSVMLWEQQWHPCAIVGAITFLHLVIWLLDMNFLTTFAMVGLFINFVDFIVPIICKSIYGPNFWTGHKEKMFEDICRSIVASYNNILGNIKSFYSMRETSPYMYYLISISILLTMAWIGSVINNVFLIYVFSMVMLLWPGIQHKGLVAALLPMLKLSPKSSLKDE